MTVNKYPVLRGLASYIFPKSLFKRPGSGGTFSASYCYSVWLRHLHYLMSNKLFESLNKIENVAEIGPGDSLGIGLCALYTGAKNYSAFDVIKHASTEANIKVNNELAQLFKEESTIPYGPKFKSVNPPLDNYQFPENLKRFDKEYYESRRTEIEKALLEKPSQASIKYIVPWDKTDDKIQGDIDLILSQAVMEHVADIEFAYSEMYKWLRVGGVISHQVDFKTHEMTKEWNGHWFISPELWKVIAHGRKYPMNRLPLSSHINVIEKLGFKISNVVPVKRENPLNDMQPEVPGVSFTESDFTTSSALIQAIKI